MLPSNRRLVLGFAVAALGLGCLERDAGRPAGEHRDLSWNHWETREVSFTELALPAVDVVDFVWVDGGNYFVVAEETGVLTRVHHATLGAVEQQRLPAKIVSVALSRAGLLVVSDSREILIVDPMSFELEGSFSVPGIGYVTSSKQLDVAFGTSARNEFDERLMIIDVSARQVVRRVTGRETWEWRTKTLKETRGARPLNRFSDVVVTPDGRYLFCRADDSLHRFRISGHELSYEAVFSGLRNKEPVVVSPEGRFVGAVRHDTEYLAFPVDDLETPVEFRLENRSQSFGLDIQGGALVTTSRGKQLVVFNPDGTKRGEYSLEGPPVPPIEPYRPRYPRVEKVLAHPGGGGALILTEDRCISMAFRRLSLKESFLEFFIPSDP